ncbi:MULTISPECIES: cytochrome c-type biogenesis protein [Photorhabdus]|uniref:cytochrome c-type biogenesis protein n=1 Tax=Photorhabdus TaxID=29487 RepID=UPI000DCCD498|nr:MULTISPECIES: cytochrome c-type biogenesis protein [Photorhabdus]MCT8342776.1 cytochrome c-type biogenesis protein CcmH [Photorhabdus kleinii]RAW99499.1 cytochrome c-type biogenesis protein CcmH [Photorhabdus sp. S10-54]RAW99605.1 cytochrome c-type biogenesis protein CcmH [Photorhabdus sp. S9-53]RAX03812.1 cytochrome c-type biogenesis protein CcmH [Photorhabdus sp. S8-52]
MKLVTLLLAGLLSYSTWATIDTYQFKSAEQEQQFHELTKQLRCPKCQNNNIADSNSIIAADMRTKVYELIIQGKNKQHIIDYMVERYGNFVTYKPPITPITLILWVSPLLFVLIGGAIVIVHFRRHQETDDGFTKQEQQHLVMLLKETDRNKP